MSPDIDLARWLEDRGVRFLRIQWVDNAGILRALAVRSDHANTIVRDGLGVVSGVQAIPVFADEVQPGVGIGAVGQVWLCPDLDTLHIIPWQRTHAGAMGRFVDHEGAHWAYCPRAALERAEARLADHGLRLECGYEHEFLLLRDAQSTDVHFESSHYASARGLDQGGPVLDDIADALEEQGVPVLSMLKEAGLSQFELATEHTDPRTAAHRFLAVRETIAAVARRHELVGTSLPKVFEDEAGSGWHVHWSLWRNDENVTGQEDGLHPLAASFAAGVLDHLPALLALTTPTPNSFRRTQPGAWAGAYQVWGMDNKEAPIRVPSQRHGAPQHIELKASDATANPFLALAGLIRCGVDGVERRLDLPAPTEVDPGSLVESERAARGIASLPATATEALDLLESDPVLMDMLGEPLSSSYLAVKRAEAARFDGLPLEAEVGELARLF